MKPEITLIKKIVNENEQILGYEVVIEFKESPSLKLGSCEVTQNENKSRKKERNKEKVRQMW